MDENECSRLVVGAAIEVHRHLGPGLLESAYESALCHELKLQGLRILRQLSLSASYKSIELPDAFRIDLLVEHLIVVEIKAVQATTKIHEVQLLTYLRFSGKHLGLLLNFHAPSMRHGIRRVVDKL